MSDTTVSPTVAPTRAPDPDPERRLYPERICPDQIHRVVREAPRP